MTLVYSDAEGVHSYAKGAPEAILSRSMLGERERSRLKDRASDWARDGFRVVAVAERDLGTEDLLTDDEIETDLVPLGLVALHDPPRETAAPAIAAAHKAGLRVEMLTGDHRLTALAVGRSLGLPAEAVHARVTPEEKLRLVERRQAEGEVVAVTGDGVNDSPALRRADVGVAMGRSGTEAAREAADLVLTNDDFATIVAAIREGRTITDNIRKFVAFLLSANLGEVVMFTIAILAGLGAPMTVVQVLLVNVLTDGLPAVALARDPASPDTMNRRPERTTGLFPAVDWGALALVGTLVGLAGLAAFILGPDGDAARTRGFATIALAELVLVFSMRSRLEQAWRAPRNPYLFAGVGLSLTIVGLTLFLPRLGEALGMVRPAPPEIALIIGLAVIPAVAVEALKGAVRRGLLPGTPAHPGFRSRSRARAAAHSSLRIRRTRIGAVYRPREARRLESSRPVEIGGVMNRLAVVAKLRPDMETRAQELIDMGPPFDPSGLGFERHSVFLTGDHVVFVFEGGQLDHLMHAVVKDPTNVGAFQAWESLLDGMPRVAREAYHWERDSGWSEGWGE